MFFFVLFRIQIRRSCEGRDRSTEYRIARGRGARKLVGAGDQGTSTLFADWKRDYTKCIFDAMFLGRNWAPYKIRGKKIKLNYRLLW